MRDKIIAASKIEPDETVLEIGPGEGFLTEALLASGAKVIAVEKDNRLIEFLRQKFTSEIGAGRLELIHDDILNFEAKKLKAISLPDGKAGYKLVANIPYYLTGKILRQFLTARHQPTLMCLMIQKEVAERIIARDGKESILSISVRAFGAPRLVATVPRGAFVPAPKVNSAILVIDEISRQRLAGMDEQKFFKMLKQGFSSKRKMLKNTLPNSTRALTACKIKLSSRAENLTLEQWLCLASQ